MSYVPAATERFTSEAEFPGGKRKWVFPCSAREDRKIPAVRVIMILLLPNLAINLACVNLPGTWQRLMPLEACGLHLWLTGLAVVLLQCF